MMNHNFEFSEKHTGPSHSITDDGKYFGTNKYTWNFDIHFPVISLEYTERLTGKNLSVAAGSKKTAEANLFKIARISRFYILSRLPKIAHRHLEYRIAHDEELIEELLLFQLEILQTWGGYESLYRVKDDKNNTSIGEAAIQYIRTLDIFTTYYTWEIPDGEYRSGY